ncbi:MAG: aminotransferase class V-fold PLP-dependent enzyme [Planctomycetota bacterium]|nr:aminotransferase class V-fold PLP-dependent enzyme [Planctomycetota bacterium]
MNLDPQNDADWSEIAALWKIQRGTCYLNHGSFGISPEPVRQYRDHWTERLELQPMDFYLRQLEPEFHATRQVLAQFVGSDPDRLVFVENSTYGMNVVAKSVSLSSGDEVVLTSHEYGAVKRIWERKCRETGARLKIAEIKVPFRGDSEILDSILDELTSRTKLLVVSHVTSGTGTIFPVKQICDRVRSEGVSVCIDGPHAPAQVDLNITDLGCDFYTASCHKWMCAPLGSGFLYVDPKWTTKLEPIVLSWGRLNPNQPQFWDEEFIWMGTRDPSPFFSIRKAIEVMEEIGFESFRSRTHWLAERALEQLCEMFQTAPFYPVGGDSQRKWFGSMCELPLPRRISESEKRSLQERLWKNHQIEVPVFEYENQMMLRVSYHLYNSTRDTRKLVQALQAESCFA